MDVDAERTADEAGDDGVVASVPAVPLAASQEEPQEAAKLPVHSTRGAAPGLRGCWALNKAGDPCGAPRRGDSDYCSAHSGYGVAGDPKGWSRIGVQASAESRRRRADLRLAVGVTRLNTPRGVLAAATFLESERLARRVVGAVLDPAVPPAQAARLGIDLVNAVDPLAVVSVSAPLPSHPDGVADLSLQQLLAVGESLGIES